MPRNLRRRSKSAPVVRAVLEPLEERRLMAVFANGIDSENMGKGIWAWDLKRAMKNTGHWPDGGSPNYTGFFTFQKQTQGMQYVITKAAQTVSLVKNTAGVQNYTSAVVNAAHAAGLKILPYFYIHGVDTAGEAAIFNQVMDTIGGDGVVFDIEGEYRNAVPNRDTAITNYFAGIGKSQSGNGSGARDNLFMAYSSFPYASHHSEVPFALLGDYCDASMPQAYWSEWNTEPVSTYVRPSNVGQPMTPTMIVDDVNSQYNQRAFDNRQTVFYNKPQSIKPIWITGMTYDGGTNGNVTTAAEITEFVNAAKNSTQVPFTGPAGSNTYVTGYRSINFFDENSTSSAERAAIAAAQVGVAPGVATLASPASNATLASGSGVVFDWSDVRNVYTPGAQTGGATSYEVFIDNVSVATVQVTGHAAGVDYSRWTHPGTIAPGAHTWRVVAKNLFGTATSTTRSFTVGAPLPLPGVPSGPTPSNTFVTSKPVTLDWADAANATSYDVYLNGAATPNFTNLTTSQATGWSPGEGVRTWRVVAKNATGTTDGPTWSFTMDSVAPAASYGAQTPANGAASLDFTVTYTDATSGVDFTSLDHNDVYVTGPNGYSQAATLVGIDAASNGATRVATYRVAAPGGTWDAGDNGVYTVQQNGGEVRDVAGGARAAGAIDTFEAALALPFAYKVGTTLHVDFDGTTTPIALAHAAGVFTARRDGTTLEFTGITDVDVSGTDLDDVLEVDGAIPVPMTFDNGAGDDAFWVTGGQYTFDADFASPQRNVDVTVAAGASAVFATTLHCDALTILGSAAVAAGGNHVLVVKNLGIAYPSGAWLDLADNDLVIDYPAGGTSPIGSLDGSTYSGVTGLIQRGYNEGGWDGVGLVTRRDDAAAGLTTLAVAEAADLYGIGPSDTALFGSETIDGSAVLVKYTYGGDTNFDGKLDADDYGTIDFSVLSPGTDGYYNGDFNFDGKIDADDYGVIDFNILAQSGLL